LEPGRRDCDVDWPRIHTLFIVPAQVLEETLREAVELLEDGEGSVEAFRLLEALDVMIEEADFWPGTRASISRHSALCIPFCDLCCCENPSQAFPHPHAS
jgi:hypothetical protein